MTMLAKFTARYDVDEAGCWRWSGYISPDGYSRLWQRVGTVLAHRWAYEWFVGPIPDGLTIDHLCRVRDCVNPEHMEPVPFVVNIERRDNTNIGIRNREKTHCRMGHAYTPDNTRVNTRRDGTHRSCRECHRLREAAKASGKPANAARTHCPQGHPYDEANTFAWTDAKGNHRRCRTCHRDRMRLRYQLSRA